MRNETNNRKGRKDGNGICLWDTVNLDSSGGRCGQSQESSNRKAGKVMDKGTIFAVIFSSYVDRLNGRTKRRYRKTVNVPGHLMTAEEIEQHIRKEIPYSARIESIRAAKRETLQLDGIEI